VLSPLSDPRWERRNREAVGDPRACSDSDRTATGNHGRRLTTAKSELNSKLAAKTETTTTTRQNNGTSWPATGKVGTVWYPRLIAGLPRPGITGMGVATLRQEETVLAIS